MKKGTTKIVLDIETVCDMIVEGNSMGQIAKASGCSLANLTRWIELDSERSARAKDARVLAARYWDEQAEQVIKDASNALEVTKARELASHYRWRAKAIAPRDYGDRQQVDMTATVKTVTQMTDDELMAIAQGART